MDQFQAKYLWLLTPYFLFVSILYLISYWGAFDINPFQYSGLTEVVAACIIPIFGIAISLLIGLFFALIAGRYDLEKMEKLTKILESHPEHSATTSLLDDFFAISTVALQFWPIFLLSIPILYLYGNFWPLMFIVGIIAHLVIYKSKLLMEISSKIFRFFLISTILYLPTGVFVFGKHNAHMITHWGIYLYAEFNNEKLIFLGHLGNKDFYINESNTKIAIIKEEVSPVFLHRHKKPFDYWGLDKYF